MWSNVQYLILGAGNKLGLGPGYETATEFRFKLHVLSTYLSNYLC